MSIKSNLLKAGALGLVATALTAGAALAATATANVNVRSGPSTGYGVIDVLSPGDRVDVTGQSNGWCEISGPGSDGWVSCAYLTNSSFDRPYRPRVNESPSVSFGFGTGGFGFGINTRPYHRPPPPYYGGYSPWWRY